MSVAGSDDEHPAVTATDLLVYDQGQLVGYLKAHDRGWGFDISSLAGVDSLRESQRDDLTQRLSQAALQLPLGIDDLQVRLQDVADTRDDSSDLAPSRLQSESIVSTPPPIPVENLQISSRHELIQDGGRALCSIQELSDILAAPMATYEALLPWLSDEPDSETGAAEIKTIFSRQFMRWWNFRKSQWLSRGLADTEGGILAFLESNRRLWEGMGAKEMVSEPSFDETSRRQWQHMPASQAPESQTFSAYHNAVKIRLAPYHFTRSLQLRKDPQKQAPWTNWLEYLSFELRYLDIFTLTAGSLEAKFDQSMRRLLRSRQPKGNHAVTSSAPSDSTHSRQRRLGAEGVNMTEELAEAQADRDATRKSIDDFVRETNAYTRARRAAFYQRHRVAWVVKEARLMETEMSLRSNSATSKKRKQGDEEPSGSQPKRTKREDGGRNANSVAPPRKSYLRRSTRQPKRPTPLLLAESENLVMSATAAKSVSIAESGWRKRVRGALGTRCGREEAYKRAMTARGVSVMTYNTGVEDEDDDSDSDSDRTLLSASIQSQDLLQSVPIASPKHRQTTASSVTASTAVNSDTVPPDMNAAKVTPGDETLLKTLDLPAAAQNNLSSAANTKLDIRTMGTSSTDFDSHSVRLGKMFIKEIIETRDKLHIGMSFGGPIWVSHKNVTDSSSTITPTGSDSGRKRARERSTMFPSPGIRSVANYKIIDMDVDINGNGNIWLKWMRCNGGPRIYKG
ncbi:MAG: hypothetical protein Q9173_005749 [Seirophora scorigena]